MLDDLDNLGKDEINTEPKEEKRIADADDIMADVELVLTREINTDDVARELEKRNEKRSRSISDSGLSEALKPEDRRALRRKKRKHDRTVALVGMIIVVAVIAVAVLVGKNYVGKLPALTKADNEEVQPTPEPIIEEEPIVEFTPDLIEEEQEPTPEPEPEVTEPVMTEEEILDTMLEEMIADMSLEEKVAGLFIITPEALTGQSGVTKAGDGTKAALEKYPIGGLIYFKQNITSESQVREMLSNTVEYSKYPLFLAVDEEGGEVARVQAGLKLDKLPSAAELGEKNDPSEVYTTYNNIGTYLADYGFNLDFAPVADTLTNAGNTAIGNRAFSDDASTVARMMPGAVNGLQDAGVSACLKHWPGQGEVDADTHEGIATTEVPKTMMEEREFVPFVAGIDVNVDMIMVGHISAPELSGDNTPCSLSKAVVTDILRDELEYDGVVITDALNMSAVSEYYGADEASIKALKAGCDMILMPEDFELAYQGVVEAVKDGTIDENRINDSLKRVYRIKYKDSVNEINE